MDELQQLRQDIDEIDGKLVELFCRRMDVTRRVGEYKRQRGIPVLDQTRERQVLQNKGELAGDELRPAVVTLYQTILALSRRQQRDLAEQGTNNPGVKRWREARDSVREPVDCPRAAGRCGGPLASASRRGCLSPDRPGPSAAAGTGPG